MVALPHYRLERWRPNSAKPPSQTAVIQAQRMRHQVGSVLLRLFHRRLPQRFWKPRPPLACAAKLIQLLLQLLDGIGNRATSGRHSKSPLQRLTEPTSEDLLRSRTLAENSPLPVWFRAMWWVTTQKNGASSLAAFFARPLFYFQRSITSSLRSRARRSDFCRVQPRLCIRRPMWSG